MTPATSRGRSRTRSSDAKASIENIPPRLKINHRLSHWTNFICLLVSIRGAPGEAWSVAVALQVVEAAGSVAALLHDAPLHLGGLVTPRALLRPPLQAFTQETF